MLTEKGMEIAKKVDDKVTRILEKINKELTEEERLQFYRSLSIISNGLDKIANRAV